MPEKIFQPFVRRTTWKGCWNNRLQNVHNSVKCFCILVEFCYELSWICVLVHANSSLAFFLVCFHFVSVNFLLSQAPFTSNIFLQQTFFSNFIFSSPSAWYEQKTLKYPWHTCPLVGKSTTSTTYKTQIIFFTWLKIFFFYTDYILILSIFSTWSKNNKDSGIK